MKPLWKRFWFWFWVFILLWPALSWFLHNNYAAKHYQQQENSAPSPTVTK